MLQNIAKHQANSNNNDNMVTPEKTWVALG